MPADGSDQLDPTSIALVAAAARDVKLPTFCAADAISWFQRAEVQFRLKREDSSTRKADHVLAALPEDVFPLISGWLTEQDGADIQYAELEQRLLQKFVATPEERADKLLTLSPLHIVVKKDSTIRPCDDYRRLNNITKADHYPLPNIADVTSYLHGAAIFSKLDLMKDYFQVPMNPEDIPKTAIITPFGTYTFQLFLLRPQERRSHLPMPHGRHPW